MKTSGSPYLLTTLESRSLRGNKFAPFASDDGTVFIFDERENSMKVVDSIEGVVKKKIFFLESEGSFCVTPNGKSVIVLTIDQRMAVYDIDACVYGERQPSRFIDGVFDPIGVVRASDDGQKIFVNSYDDYIAIYDFDSGRLSARIKNDSDERSVNHLAFSLGPKNVALLHEAMLGYAVSIFDVSTGKKFLSRTFQKEVLDIQYTPNLDVLSLLTIDGCISIWDIRNDILTTTKKIEMDHGVKMTARFGLSKAAHVVDGTLTLLDIRGSEDIKTTADGYDCFYPALKFIRGGKYLLSICSLTVHVYSTDLRPFWTIGRHLEFNGETGAAIRLVFMANRILASKKKRSRSLFPDIPKEIMCHIFSFIERPY